MHAKTFRGPAGRFGFGCNRHGRSDMNRQNSFRSQFPYGKRRQKGAVASAGKGDGNAFLPFQESGKRQFLRKRLQRSAGSHFA